VITFTPGHTAQFGLVALGILGIVTAVGLGLAALGLATTKTGRGLHLWQALVSLVVGSTGVGPARGGNDSVAVGTRVLGFAGRGCGNLLWRALAAGDALRRDWMTQGGMTVALAVVVLFQPADSVAVVGFLGAWAIVQGVYMAIASVALRFPTTTKDFHD
jgi:hypothetical protein